MLKTEAISNFLHNQPYHMAQLYTPEMEVQVNVARDNGNPITGTYAGLRWQGYTDGLQTWKHFRIPWNAGIDPTYTDRNILFDISHHAEAIGLTGWDWVNKKSRWVGFDFDSILTHTEGLDQNELQRIQRTLEGLDFISLFTSTSGSGLHVYCFLNIKEQIGNHTEHAAIARAVLAKISAQTGLELEAKVDILGGNMWVWHRKAILGKSLELLKEGVPLTEIPSNWRDYLSITSRGRVTQTNKNQALDEIIANRNKVTLDDDHLKLLKYLDNTASLWWFDDQKQMVVCHTADLKKAHLTLNCKGFFDTIATGKDHGQDQNCFCFPQIGGAWIIRRHTRGVREHESWFTDNSGWTTCYFNKLPNLRQSSKIVGGIETEKGYIFNTLSECYKVALVMGIDIPLPDDFKGRKAGIEELRDNRARVFFKGTEDDVVPGWAFGKKKQWEYYFYLPRILDETDLPDHVVRHVVTQETEYGWFINTNNDWIMENKSNLFHTMISLRFKRPEIENLLGRCVLNNWKLVNKPFKPEYTGNREWNKQAAKLKYIPERGQHKTWDLILNHCGTSLTDTLLKDKWALDNGIINGLLYLQAWISSVLQNPEQPTPYLFLYGNQNTGKSILHESLSLLFTAGYCRADQSLTNPNGFNGELAGAVFCIIEETNLSKKGPAKDRIKDWVTGLTISIRALFKSPYMIENTTHWIQCANSPEYCPVFPGDTRITMVNIGAITDEIPKDILLRRCTEEAPAFLYTLLHFDLPEKEGRLGIPVLETAEKKALMASNESLLLQFIKEEVYEVGGSAVLFSEFVLAFQRWLSPNERLDWTPRKVGKQIPFLKGKYGNENQIHIGNISMTNDKRAGPLLKAEKGYLKC